MKVADEVLAGVGSGLQKVDNHLRSVLEDSSEETRAITLHLADGGGKRVRPIMTLLAARVFDENTEPAVPVAVAAELIHMATLVHDDVIDQADTRRGRPTVNSRWGNLVSVLSGDCLLAKALVVLVDQGRPEIVRIMADMIFRMCEGEIVQNATLGDVRQKETDYFERIEKKTALFFGACCQAGGLINGASQEQAEALAQYGRDIGMAFQIVDDLLDLSADAEVVGKPVGADLAAGILTLPVIYLLQRSQYKEQVLPLLTNGPLTEEGVRQVVALVRENGAIDYSYRVAADFAHRAKERLTVLPASSRRELLAGVAEYTINRSF